jgi:arabinofuranosyltransferase
VSSLSSRRRLLLAVSPVLVALLASVFAGGRSSAVFAQDVELTGITVPREIAPGSSLALAVRLKVRHPLDARRLVFVHVQGPRGCQAVGDGSPDPPSTSWGDQKIDVDVRVSVPPGCEPGTADINVGLYDPATGARLKLLEPPADDNALCAGWVDVVPSNPDVGPRTLTVGAARLRLRRFVDDWRPALPLAPWIAGVIVAMGLAAWIVRKPRRGARDAPLGAKAGERPVWVRRLGLAAPAVPFFLGILVVLEWVKDDAYISFRYAHNLVSGHGLVFNTGERLEGFTNFLWVFILAPFEALGWDLFQVCEVLGTVLGITCLVLTARMTEWIGGGGQNRALSFLWSAVWLSTSSSFVLWAKAGLEQPLVSLLPVAGAFVLWRARDLSRSDVPDERRSAERRYLASGLILGAGCMTRPELHLLAILVGAPLVVDAARRRAVTRAEALYAAGILAVTVPCHAFRYAYYGALVPNTFYVKTGTGSVVWHAGLGTLREMLLFNATGVLVLFAPLSFASRRRVVEKGTMAAIAAAFMVYYVKVGVDEMQWHRLYLPALPFLCVLAACGLQEVIEAAVSRLATKDDTTVRMLAYGLGWGGVLFAAGQNFQFTYREQHGFDGHGDLAGTFHPDLGKFLVRHERPGGLVAFQDMGSTPYHAPDINFLDFCGLVDRTVAHARHDYGLHAWVGGDPDAERRYEAEMRDYFFRRGPEWTILTIYTPEANVQRTMRQYDEDPTGASFGDAYRDNPFEFKLWDDPRFGDRYVAVRAWPRSSRYFLVLWRRRDLWDQKPREVVLDEPPPGLAGARASFEGGLELLGSEMTHETIERHEAFITTWWKLPGPMARDTMFFVHVTRSGFQTPADHVPGDWLYPADRWHAGEILEDRTLFQLPPLLMKPGTYKVYLGAYRRGTGERLKVLAGASDGQDRVLLGELTARALRPILDQLIPPTRVDAMRKHPERIVDSQRGSSGS